MLQRQRLSPYEQNSNLFLSKEEARQIVRSNALSFLQAVLPENKCYCIEMGRRLSERGERRGKTGMQGCSMQVYWWQTESEWERTEVLVGGKTEDKGRIEPSVWGSSITVHQRAEFSRQSNLFKTLIGRQDQIKTDMLYINTMSMFVCL